MSSAVLSKKKSNSKTSAKKGSRSQAKELDARRRLDERLEEIKLARQLREFDFDL